MEDRILREVEYTGLNGNREVARERIIRETSFGIRINGEYFTGAMIMASMETEFVIGCLFGQRVIDGIADIESLSIKDNTADVTLKEKKERNAVPVVESDLIVRKEDVFDCVRAILKSEVFEETEAVHSAGIFRNGSETVCIAEDLGRHNALDKVIGYCLMHNIDLSNTLAASTGRQPSEMIIKCLRAGIPIIATKGVPTTLAVELAKDAGITIAGLVRGDTMIVYSTPARIV